MSLFNANVIPWLIPLPPLIAFVAIILGAGRSRTLTHILAVGGIALAWLLGFAEVLNAWSHGNLGTTAGGVLGSSITWLDNGNGLTGSGTLHMGVFIDPLNSVLLFMVPLICLLIFIYSIGYMADDPRSPRFFAYLSLFAGAMLVLVVADNLLLLFIGWEVMGLCSYLLIGFWYEKESAYKAAIKAFMTTRVADVIFMLGIAYLWSATGTLNFRDILNNPEVLKALGSTPALGGFLGFTVAGLIGTFIVIGTIGKSAQFPLHVWLPDAMEGPTPVSAMIHAATMVSAGVYLVIRMYPLISAGGNPEAGIFTAPMTLMSLVGAFTALFAATIALTQHDIKRVLAYSTISQLGYMVAALGVGAFAAAAFHLITHAFFKALLFLGSGSVIHGMEHGEHLAHTAHGEHDAHAIADPHAKAFDPQDMRNMGGLVRNMPVTAITFIIGGMALSGFPLITSGFWSKDAIFAEAWNAAGHNPLALVVVLVLAIAAILTVLYTTRQIAMTFFGEPRSEAAQYAMHNDGTLKGRRIAAQLTAPLITLAVFAIFAGYVEFTFGHWVNQSLLAPPPDPTLSLFAVIISFAVFLIGAFFGWTIYLAPALNNKLRVNEPDAVEEYLGAETYHLIARKYGVDEFYDRVVIRPARWLSNVFSPRIVDQNVIDRVLAWIVVAANFIGSFLRAFNTVVIDGVGDSLPAALRGLGSRLRTVQDGHIQRYLLYVLAGVLVLGINLAIVTLLSAPVVVGLVIVEVIVIAILIYFFFGTERPLPTRGGGD